MTIYSRDASDSVNVYGLMIKHWHPSNAECQVTRELSWGSNFLSWSER